ncbi:hypothetical protein RXV95_09140 [Novosphingobium sp. ZN18A2]|uniref:hypothetical protein n=1 Tax=Novosphingobium sp. ZN18A2 TaxID=3079861 RepID=UPI0030D346F9
MSVIDGPVLGISPKMYRHFAIATIAIAAIVAMFADDSHRQAVAANIHQRERKVALQRQERDKLGITYKVGATPKEPAHWGSESPGNFGSPTIHVAGDGGSAVYSTAADFGPGGHLQIDRAAIARMTPLQRAAYFKRLEEERRREEAEGPSRPTEAQVDSLIAASAARSGADVN